jgi:septum formation inhibitor-activating ATPase MinD
VKGNDIVWSKEIKDFGAYLFGFTGVADKAADYLWNRIVGQLTFQDEITALNAHGEVVNVAERLMASKEYKDIVKLLKGMTLYFGHDYIKDFVDTFKISYLVEVTA